MKNKYSSLLIAICLSGFTQLVLAQSSYTIPESKTNDIKLSGTSSMHDWDMSAHAFTGEAQFTLAGDDQQLSELNALSFSLPVSNLKSDKSGLDKNAYKALKTDQHKNIDYQLSSASMSTEQKGLIETEGNLTIAGVTKEVAMNVYCVVNKDSTISCTGSEKLKMTDYQVKPPTFMLGAMSTGDDITLNFTVVFKK